MAAACSRDILVEPDIPSLSLDEDVVFHASIDRETEEKTKTFFDDNLNVLWNADDRVTIFKDLTNGKEYRFVGEDGDPGGDLEFVPNDNDNFSAGSDLGGYNYALYPHSSETKIKGDGTITYNFPDLQTYRENSFGRGANVMIAKSVDTDLRFKNALGYLSLRLYGADVHVSSVILKANGGEVLAGKGEIVLEEGGIPSVSMLDDDNAKSEIRLYCDDVALGASSNDYTEFMFAIPPMSFTKAKGGFTITVKTTDGGVFSKTANIDLQIQRNRVEWMSPIQVVPSYATSYNQPRITSLSSTRNNKTYTATANNLTYTLTIPTVTDFSQLVLNFSLGSSNSKLMVGGKEITSGVTFVDASKPLSLVVKRGDYEKTFTLIAQNTGLPVVRITTEGFNLAILESYKNSIDSQDHTDHRVWLPDDNDPSQSDWSATVRIENPDGTPGMGDNSVYEVVTQIKGRGNYTWTWEKKPYALKLASNVKVLGMPAHKRWVLLANWRDRTLLRNDAAFWLSREAGMDYTVRGQFVELEFNGEHRGNYYLCEQIKIDPERVNITEVKNGVGFADLSGGYLMEIDSYWDELNKFKSSEFNLRYMFKEPDNDPITSPKYAPAYEWMENHIGEFERVLKSRSGVENHMYENYLDVDSAIWFMLLNELTGNRDFFQNVQGDVYGPHSTYIHKDKGGKLIMGPIWDFDYETFIPASYYGSSWGGSSGFFWRGFDKTEYYYHWLCYDSKFVQRIKYLWNEKKDDFMGLTAYIDLMYEKILLSQQFDESLWPGYTQKNRNDNHDYNLSFPNAIQRMKESFLAKIQWMDTQINALSTTSPDFKYE